MLVVMYNALVKPKDTVAKNKEELYQEVMLMIICYCLLLFTRFIPEPEAENQYLCGWYFIAVISILVGVNMCKVATTFFKDVRFKIKKKLVERYFKSRKSFLFTPKTVSPNANHSAFQEDNEPILYLTFPSEMVKVSKT